jgi:hypothetical protein
MLPNNEVDSAWQAYQITLDCLKIASHAVFKNDMALLNKTSFFGSPHQTAHNQIEASRRDADDYVILAMWAAFERTLLGAVQAESQRMLAGTPGDLAIAVHGKMAHEIEYWRIDDVLNLFKVIIDPHLIGQTKQVKQYRDWVAHRNLKKGSPQMVLPQTAYRILAEMLRQLPA